MKKNFDLVVVLVLFLIVLFYFPFINFFMDLGDSILIWDKLYSVINPFTSMLIILGGISLYFINSNHGALSKILFLIIYGFGLFMKLTTVILVLSLSLRNILIYLLPHLFIISLHFHLVRSNSTRDK